ncbi:MAG: NAD-dependent epimerase/dehydratase family protein [Bdellovibrionales bacterium]|nr:NAD-dependent epimerase/dehydratase family protein [Bdellovibrionales bacterium]
MRVALVTGGGGFVGGAITRQLIQNGIVVRSLGRGEYPELQKLGVETYRHDLGSNDSFPREILEGVDTIFHTAAHVKMWGRYDDFYRINVQGTQKLLDQAVRAGVQRFVYTSSPSVVASGKDLLGVDESTPYPKRYEAFYPETKARAEQEVLQKNSDTFHTCALRPHLIFGPGDTNLIPTVVSKARSGNLRQIGDGKNLVDFSYIEDCVTGHLLAAKALESNAESRGLAYFISQGDPYLLWEWVSRVVQLSGLPELKGSVPTTVAHGIATLLEMVSRLFPAIGEPRFTRFLVHEMATSHYFNIQRARNLLGYSPSVTVAEGLKKTFATGRLRQTNESALHLERAIGESSPF